MGGTRSARTANGLNDYGCRHLRVYHFHDVVMSWGGEFESIKLRVVDAWNVFSFYLKSKRRHSLEHYVTLWFGALNWKPFQIDLRSNRLGHLLPFVHQMSNVTLSCIIMALTGIGSHDSDTSNPKRWSTPLTMVRQIGNSRVERLTLVLCALKTIHKEYYVIVVPDNGP